MKRLLLLLCLLLFVPATVCADTDAVINEMHKRQLIIAGQEQGSVDLARRELRELMQKYAKEESNQQLGKALEWLESQSNGLGFQTDIESLYNGFNRYAGRTSVVPLEMSFVQLAVINEKYEAAKTSVKEYTDHAKRGYSYIKRMYELSGVFEQNQEPAAKRLSSNLSLLADIMSNYGDKIPVVGAFISAYGNVTGEMLKAVDKLGERLNARNPWLNDATYGSNELTRAYRNQFPGDVWLTPVLGLRDCYISDNEGLQRVYIFDPKSRHRDRSKGIDYEGAFVPVNMYPPFDAMSVSQTIRELRRRYMMFDNAGVKTPGVRRVLREASRIVRIEPLIDYASIQAGQGFTVQMLAYYMVDGLPVPRSENLGLVLSQDAGYWGTETQTTRNGQFLTWKAPEAAGRYELSVDLAEETKSAGWHLHQSKAVKTAYIVGAPTHLSLSPARVSIATTGRRPVPIAVKLQDETGAGFISGDLILEVKPQGSFGLQIPGSYLDPRPLLELSGKELASTLHVNLVPLETAVIEPGLVQISARYTDGSKRIAAALASIRVQEPRIVEDSHIKVKTRKNGQGFDFAVTVSDEKEQKVRVGKVTVTALSGGLFKTYRGAEHSVDLDLTRPGFVTWMPGKDLVGGKRFLLEFSGGAWEDALYKPASNEWIFDSPEDEIDTPPLFFAANPPVAPPALDVPSDAVTVAESGYLGKVETVQWEQIEEEKMPPAESTIESVVSEGGLFSGVGIPVSPPDQASTPDAGNLFAGVGDGFGVSPQVDEPTSAEPSANLFAAIETPVKMTEKPVKVSGVGQNAGAQNDSSMREWVIKSVNVSHESGEADILTPGQSARVYLTTEWAQLFMERVRLKIQIDQQTVFDEIHVFRDRTGTFKTDFYKVIRIPAGMGTGKHTLRVTGELAKAAPMIAFRCQPQSITIEVKATEEKTADTSSSLKGQIASSINLQSARTFASSAGLPDVLMAAPGFAETLEDIIALHKMPKSDARAAKITKAWLKSGWVIGLTFKNNDVNGQLKGMYVQRRTGSGGNKQVIIYRLGFSMIDGKWQKSLEKLFDPSANGNFWYEYQAVMNRDYRIEKTGDGSGPHPVNIKTWYRPNELLIKENILDPLSGKEIEQKIYNLKNGTLVQHQVIFPEGGYDMTEWRPCGHLAFHRVVSGGQKNEERGAPCDCH